MIFIIFGRYFKNETKMKLFKTLAIALLIAITFPVSAIEPEYTPTTTWPYLYEKFQEGTVKTLRGETIRHGEFNLSLAQGKGHFISNGTLMELDVRSIVEVTIGDDLFVPVGGKLVKVIKKTENSVTALQITIDIDAMSQSEVGYGGKSALTNTQKVSANAIAGGSDSSEYRSISDISADDGEPLTLKKVRGFICNWIFVPASKYDIFKIQGIDKAAVKKFIKDNKIRLSDDDDLSKLADFINSTI